MLSVSFSQRPLMREKHGRNARETWPSKMLRVYDDLLVIASKDAK